MSNGSDGSSFIFSFNSSNTLFFLYDFSICSINERSLTLHHQIKSSFFSLPFSSLWIHIHFVVLHQVLMMQSIQNRVINHFLFGIFYIQIWPCGCAIWYEEEGIFGYLLIIFGPTNMSKFVKKDLANKKRFVNREPCCEIEVRLEREAEEAERKRWSKF